MVEWAVAEHRTAGGRSRFAEFVASLAKPKDIKDAAILIGALRRPLGNQLREPRSKSLEDGLFELRGMQVRIYYGFLPNDALCCSAAT